ncbi:MAG: glycosyl hydrolase [Chloroflexi bacterium]|nr:MAG: glycosyl hydrolase [Chloroflexota bacterium]
MSSATTGIPGEETSLVARLDLEQKVRLLTGRDSWVLYGVGAVGLRPMVLSDGPAGVRGTRFDRDDPSSSLPCGVGLAATWDERLVQEVALALGREARAKGVDVLLGPTVNIVRTPLAGRGFECFSEDPLLTTRMAVAYVRGVQQAGVAATAKHFVGNDSETDRRTYDARITDQVLRELYLPPFEACVAEADVALVMAAYNSVNGATMTANKTLLRGLLKGEWGFRGVVVSDWSATNTTVPSALGGLDLVMPGPRGPWGDQLLAAVRAGRVPEAEIDDKVARLLVLAERVGALDGSVDGEAVAPPTPRAPIDPALLREVTARSFVMLANHGGLLPLDAGATRKLALIGPNAVDPQTQGGGSVRVLAVARPGLAEALSSAPGGPAVSVHQGCLTSATIRLPAAGSLRDPVSGDPGVRLEIRSADGAIVHEVAIPSSVVTWWDGLPEAVDIPGSQVVMRTRYRAEVDGPHVLGAAAVGLVRVAVDGSQLAEARTLPPRDVVEALSRPPELRVPVQLRAGQEVEVRVEHRPDVRGRYGFVTMRLGIAPQKDDDTLLEEAVQAAAAADVAVVVVGSADGSESEGYDRETMVLPGRQDELVRRVAAANARTVVVVNSGMPVLMPWVDDVAAVIQAWLPGQAFGEALADVLLGVIEPGGRLPVSLPRAEADSPVLHAYPEAGELPYSEGLLVGYRGYDRKGLEPLFCFGHGHGYTDWSYESLAPEAGTVAAGQDLAVVVTVRNTGGRSGREVVQLYLEGPDDEPERPLRLLAAFASVAAGPGDPVEARLTVPARSFARFDEGLSQWAWRPGTYSLHAGRSSRDLRLSAEVVLR